MKNNEEKERYKMIYSELNSVFNKHHASVNRLIDIEESSKRQHNNSSEEI